MSITTLQSWLCDYRLAVLFFFNIIFEHVIEMVCGVTEDDMQQRLDLNLVHGDGLLQEN